MRTTILLATILALALFAPASAYHCASYTTTIPLADTAAAASDRYYVDNDEPWWWNVWIYEESNGIDGLQRYDEIVDDTCHRLIPGDTVIF